MIEGVKWDTNTPRIIDEPEHPYLENTIPSIEAALRYGDACTILFLKGKYPEMKVLTGSIMMRALCALMSR